ncbi:MAG: hypothetical protein ACK41T_12865, partial [Pseudobdellovibrio sp.]
MKTYKKVIIYIVQFIVLASFIMTAFSQFAMASDNADQDTLIPVVDPKDLKPTDYRFFSHLRRELQDQQSRHMNKQQGSHVVVNVTKRFPIDTMSFFLAGGAVFFTKMNIATGSNPLMMVQHIESLKDPIAHISFYAFMMANGIYIDTKTKGMDQMNKALAMRQLQYKGLAIGSLASSITADILHTMDACVDGWVANKNNKETEEACDEAFKQWTLRNKTTQYIPQILSLIASQKVADIFEAGTRKVMNNKLSLAVKAKADLKLTKVFKLTESAITFFIGGPGKWGVKLLHFAGQTTRFGVFLAIDQLIMPTMTRVGGTLLQPLYFGNDALKMNSYLFNASKNSWDSSKAQKDPIACSLINCKDYTQLPDEVKNMAQRLTEWRMHLNGEAEIELNGWIETFDSFVAQVQYAKTFYKIYIENLFSTLERQYRISRGELKHIANPWERERIYPFRTLPLFGVKPLVAHEDDVNDPKQRELFSNKNTLILQGSESVDELYINEPFRFKRSQSEFIIKTVSEYLKSASFKNLLPTYKDIINQFAQPLLVGDIKKQAVALTNLNNEIETLQYSKTKLNSKATESRRVLNNFRDLLGNPRPQLTSGAAYTMAFDNHPTYSSYVKDAKFDTKYKSLNLKTAGDMMVFNMVCAGKNATYDTDIFHKFRRTLLTTPNIMNTTEKPDFCDEGLSFLTPKGLEVTTYKLYTTPIKANGRTYKNINEYISVHMRRDLYNTASEDYSGPYTFSKWWDDSVNPAAQKQAALLDKKFEKVVDEVYKIVLDRKDFKEWFIDSGNLSKFLPKNIEDTFHYELDIYLTILKSAMLADKVNSESILKDLAENVANNKNNTTMPSIKNIVSTLQKKYPELVKMAKIDYSKITDLDTLRDNMFAPIAQEVAKLPQQTVQPSKATINFKAAANMNDLKKQAQALITNVYADLSENNISTNEKYRKQLNEFVTDLRRYRIQELEVAYRSFLSLLRADKVDINKLADARDKIFNTNEFLFGPLRQAVTQNGMGDSTAATLLSVGDALQ